MISSMQLVLNQQLQQGYACAQQGLLAEQVGNWLFAAQCYDQSIATIGNAMAIAGQSGMPILDDVFASFAVCHFQAARAKAAAGWGHLAPAHLAASLQAINQAIAIRPDVGQYRMAASIVEAAQGSFSAISNLPPSNQSAHLQPQQGSASSGKASQKQWVELATGALNVLNTFGGMFQQSGQQNGGDSNQWNQGAWGY
jgi:hypothetical protein